MHDSAVEMESAAGGQAAPAPGEPAAGPPDDPWAELERGMRAGPAGRAEPGLELMPDVVQQRSPRVRFKHPVRVVPLGGAPRAYRLLASNLSSHGMFLAMPTPLEPGTRVALSLEAGGRVLPFAEAEVRWKRLQPQKGAGAASGFGVRFVNYLHPRARELVEYLVANLDTGKPLPEPAASRRGRLWLGTLIAAAGFAAAAALVFVLSGSIPPEGAAPAAVAAAPQWQPAPAPAAAPVAASVATLPELDLAGPSAADAPRSAQASTGEPAAALSPEAAAPEAERAPQVADAPALKTVASKSGPLEGATPAAHAEVPQPVAKVVAPAAAASARGEAVAPKPSPPREAALRAPEAQAAKLAAAPAAAARRDAPKPAAPPARPAVAAKAPAPAKGQPRLAAERPAESPPRAAVPTNVSARARSKAQVIPLAAAGAVAKLLVEDARGELRVTVEPIASGRVAKVFTLDAPPRIVFDVEGGAPKKSLAVTLSGKQLKQVRVGKLGQGTRVVVDLAKKPSGITQEGDAAILSY